MNIGSSRPTGDGPQSPTAAGPQSPTAAGPSCHDIDNVAGMLRTLRRGDVERRMWPLVWAPNDPLVTIGQFDTLELLASRPRWHMAEIAEALEVSPSTATRSLDPLVAGRLADRRLATHDKRLTLVTATHRGRRLCRRLAERRVELLTEVMDDFSASEINSLVGLVSRLLGNVDHIVQCSANPGSDRRNSGAPGPTR